MASRPFFDDPPPPPPAALPAPPRIRTGSLPAPIRWARLLVRGREEDAAWVRPSLIGLLGIAAFLYLWDLGASGWANAFYSAAVQAGSTSWKAFFFGSFDASNFITVDKSPAALWVMDLSARVFGVNAWSILVPQALEGVATVGFTYLTVRRWFPPAAGLIAGATVALTPVAALMFRFDNPDALLVLLLTIATYATVRAIEAGKTRWLVLAATLVGFAFLTKMLQAFLVVPAFGLVYLLAAPVSLRRRMVQLAVAAGTMVVASGWWVAIVQLTPAADRPYIGGSQDNSLLNLIFGYNGFGRLTGNETGSVGGSGAAGSMWGPTGLDRLFNASFGGQISWLLPAALILLVAGLGFTLVRSRTDRTRAAFLLWGGSLAVTALVFSLAAGIIHPYYTVALAPAIGALVGMGSVLLWRERSRTWARLVLAGAVAATSAWSATLLERSPQFASGLATAVAIVGIGSAVAIVVVPLMHRRVVAAVLVAGLAAAFAGPAAYTINTVITPHSGAIPSAGPTVTAANSAVPRACPAASPVAVVGAGFRAVSPAETSRRAASAAGRPSPAADSVAVVSGSRAGRGAAVGSAADRSSTPAPPVRRSSSCSRPTPVITAGLVPQSTLTRQPATSSQPAIPSWRSAASTEPIRRRHSRSSSSTSPKGASTTSWAPVDSAVAAAAMTARVQSRSGWSNTSPRHGSTVSPFTT